MAGERNERFGPWLAYAFFTSGRPYVLTATSVVVTRPRCCHQRQMKITSPKYEDVQQDDDDVAQCLVLQRERQPAAELLRLEDVARARR